MSFTWTGSDNVTSTANLVYAYRLEPLASSFSAFSSATSKNYSDLSNGSYTFHVVAKDAAGNVDPSSATRSFTVDVAPPPPPPPPPQVFSVVLELDRETVLAGDVVGARMTTVNSGAAFAADVYLVAILPPSVGPAVGCPQGDALAFLIDGGAGFVLACLSDPPNTFPAYIQDFSILGGNVITPDFLSVVWPLGAPPGPYTFGAFVARTDAVTDNTIGEGDIIGFGLDGVIAH